MRNPQVTGRARPPAGSGSLDLDEGTSFGIDIGLYRDSTSFYEILYTRQESGIDSPDPVVGSVDIATEYLHFGGTLLFPDEYWYVPWLSLTIGATRLHILPNPSGLNAHYTPADLARVYREFRETIEET